MPRETYTLDCCANSNIRELYKNSDRFNILSRNGTFTIAKDLGYMPPWATSFKERGVENGKTIILTSNNYNHENLFVELEIPRQWRSMRIENEIVLDSFEDRAFVQRVYWIDSSDREVLVEVSTAVRREEVTEYHGNLNINSEWKDPNSKDGDISPVLRLILADMTVEELLVTPLPISRIHP